jgi:hypothetical protein
MIAKVLFILPRTVAQGTVRAIHQVGALFDQSAPLQGVRLQG